MGWKIPYILNEDENDRIGSIYTIQGVDMDYAGVIIGKDLRYINGKVILIEHLIQKMIKIVAYGVRRHL